MQSIIPHLLKVLSNYNRFIEANLFVICGSMPTLRKFFRHFLPRLVGTSEEASYIDGGSRTNQQRSVPLSRVRKQRNKYALFPEGAENDVQIFSMKSFNRGTTTVSISGNADVQMDDHSEKAILQTKSFTVQHD
jgi:hypothetical protein